MKKQPMYSIMLLTTVLCTLGAISTMLPQESVSKISLLGYKAHCPFSPVSTLLCLLLAGVSCKIRAKKYKGE
jgi:energy-converting hydrogenase Eha subunit C